MKRNRTLALVAVILMTAATLLGCGGKPVLAATVGDQEITVTAGATQALFTAIAAFVRPGDEVIALLKMSAKKYGQTIVMITHDDEIAQVADRILVIEDGQVVDFN